MADRQTQPGPLRLPRPVARLHEWIEDVGEVFEANADPRIHHFERNRYQGAWGISPCCPPVALGIIAPISGSLSDRFGSRPITVAGLAVLMIGFLAISTLDAETTSLGYVLRFLPAGLGMGLFQSPNNSAIMGAAPRDRLGIASGMLAMTRTLGQITGIAALGALWAGQAFKYTGKVLPGGATTAPIPAQVLALRDTFVTVSVLIFAALLQSCVPQIRHSYTSSPLQGNAFLPFQQGKSQRPLVAYRCLRPHGKREIARAMPLTPAPIVE